jgi:sulfur carrier protein
MITVNGEQMSLDRVQSVYDWLEAHKINPKLVGIEHNLTLLTQDQYRAAILRDGDYLEIVHFVGGG